MRPEDRARRAEAANQLKANPLFKEAFLAAEDSILRQMRDVKMRDTEMHTRLIQALQVQDAVVRYLNAVINDGVAANKELEVREKGRWRL